MPFPSLSFHFGSSIRWLQNFPVWNFHCQDHIGCMQSCHLGEVLSKCLILFPLLSNSFFLSFHYFHFFSFVLTFFISNSLSCVLLSLSFESKLPVPYLVSSWVYWWVSTHQCILALCNQLVQIRVKEWKTEPCGTPVCCTLLMLRSGFFKRPWVP